MGLRIVKYWSLQSRLLLCLAISALALSACAPDVVRHNNAGNDHFDESAYDDAIAEYQLAQVDEPDLAEPYYNAANAYNRQSQIEAALAQTEQALKTANPELAAQAWYNLGNAFFDAEQWPQAVEAYKESLRLQPGDLDAKHNLELALQKLQEQEQQEQEQEQEQDQEDQEQEQQEQESGDEQQEQEQDEQAGATPESQPGEGQETPQPSGEPQEATEGMTEEQAIQLLQALLGDSQTLQERLQEIYQAPGPASDQDW